MDESSTTGIGTEKVTGKTATHCPVAMITEPTKCSYCKKVDSSWNSDDLFQGKRSIPNGIEYHCYSAYCD